MLKIINKSLIIDHNIFMRSHVQVVTGILILFQNSQIIYKKTRYAFHDMNNYNNKITKSPLSYLTMVIFKKRKMNKLQFVIRLKHFIMILFYDVQDFKLYFY